MLKKLDFLEMEATVQKAKIRQAQKAVTLSKNKKSMDVEYFESEKTLLLSGEKNFSFFQNENRKCGGRDFDCNEFFYFRASIECSLARNGKVKTFAGHCERLF